MANIIRSLEQVGIESDQHHWSSANLQVDSKRDVGYTYAASFSALVTVNDALRRLLLDDSQLTLSAEEPVWLEVHPEGENEPTQISWISADSPIQRHVLGQAAGILKGLGAHDCDILGQ